MIIQIPYPPKPPPPLPLPRHGTHTRPVSMMRGPKGRKRLESLKSIGTLEPPWLVNPPASPQNPFSGDPLFDFRVQSPSVPFSLRLVQLMIKKKKKQRSRVAAIEPSNFADLGSLGTAIWSLARMIDDLQRSMWEEEEEDFSGSSGDSFAWLFSTVFFKSPNLAVGILTLTSDFIAFSTESSPAAATATAIESEPSLVKESLKIRGWSDVGILDEAESVLRSDDLGLGFCKNRRLIYERMIVTERPNSMILSNYAQLLYQYEKDLDRAEEYFRWAVREEPVDGEAMSRFARFLWEARGDSEAAEEMFLAAIEAEPENVYHRSNYAWFLWGTGGLEDTCYPLDGGGGGVELSEL